MVQTKVGKVVSTKMQKTVVVEVQSSHRHPIYKKLIKKTKKIKAHYELGINVGQKVKIGQVRPISKGVHFKVLEVIQ